MLSETLFMSNFLLFLFSCHLRSGRSRLCRHSRDCFACCNKKVTPSSRCKILYFDDRNFDSVNQP
jgi:hypothetical protein